jgi:hypothetical protein
MDFIKMAAEKATEEELASRQVAYTVLNDIFTNINEQLRFAETKNGALFSVNLAVVLGAAAIFSDHATGDDRLPLGIENWLLGVALWLAVAALIGLFSFFPETKPRTAPAKVIEEPNNIFFFGHIRAWSETEFLKRVFDGMGLSISPLPAHTLLANQISSNSQNAHKKFTLFAVAVVVTLVALGWSSVLLVFRWLFWGL